MFVGRELFLLGIKVAKPRGVAVLRRETGVNQAVVVRFVDDEGDKLVSQTFTKHYQAAYPAVAVLERVDLLEAIVVFDDVFKRDDGEGVVLIVQLVDVSFYVLRQGSC